MKKVRYIKGSDYYDITSVSLDYVTRVLHFRYRYVFSSPYGLFEVQEFTGMYNDELTKRYDLVVDPNWSSSSTPPKPENFDLTDPGTWGTITWEEIPKISIPLYRKFTDFMARETTGASLPIFSDIEKYIYGQLIDNEDLPPQSDGWELKLVEVAD